MKKSKKYLVLGMILTYACLAVACTRNTAGNNGTSGEMTNDTIKDTTVPSGTPSSIPAETGTQPVTPAEDLVPGTDVTDPTAADLIPAPTTNDGALGNALDDAGNAVGNIVNDAADGVTNITDDLLGSDPGSTTSTTGNGNR